MKKTTLRLLPFLIALLYSFGTTKFSFAQDPAPADLSIGDDAAAEEDIWDPIEKVNRGIFWFNNQFDRFLLEPVAEGYDYVLPEFAKKGVRNFFENLRYPQYLLSDLIQLKFEQAGNHTKRFALNTTLGVLGVNDIAANHFGIEREYEDFGIALGYHGVEPGPYLVIPIIGPSNARDALGLIVDSAINPVQYPGYANASDDITIPLEYGLRALNVISVRARLLDTIKTARESSVDYYLFVRAAYYQDRAGDIKDEAPPDLGDPALRSPANEAKAGGEQ